MSTSIHVGKGAFIGTGAVVVKDIPSEEVWVGNPAKKIKKRNDNNTIIIQI